jgi:hypothetical protein
VPVDVLCPRWPSPPLAMLVSSASATPTTQSSQQRTTHRRAHSESEQPASTRSSTSRLRRNRRHVPRSKRDKPCGILELDAVCTRGVAQRAHVWRREERETTRETRAKSKEKERVLLAQGGEREAGREREGGVSGDGVGTCTWQWRDTTAAKVQHERAPCGGMFSYLRSSRSATASKLSSRTPTGVAPAHTAVTHAQARVARQLHTRQARAPVVTTQRSATAAESEAALTVTVAAVGRPLEPVVSSATRRCRQTHTVSASERRSDGGGTRD